MISRLCRIKNYGWCFLLIICLPAGLIVGCRDGKSLGSQTIKIGENWAEFKVPYIPEEGENPYDVHAEAHFKNVETEEVKEVPMYFAMDSMVFRFAALNPGAWTFKTRSKNPKLEDFIGEVLIVTSDDPSVNGYLTNHNKKWYWQASKKAIVPQLVMARRLSDYEDLQILDEDLSEFIDNHGFNGLHIPPVSMGWFDLQHTFKGHDQIDGDPNPSPETFELLERVITRTYRSGGILHFWFWGDESRKQTPVKWGLNDTIDRRFQRYFSARMGALPGWSASYGFDLPEWVTPEQLQQWHDTLQSLLVIPHLISGRSKKHQMTPYAKDLSYESYEHHRPDYDQYLEIYQNSQDKPVFSEDRFRIRNRTVFAPKDYSEALTFRGMWESTMAGGVANIWGNLALPDGKNNSEYSLPYANKDAIKTYNRFFFSENRFTKDFEPLPGKGDLLLAEVPDRNILIGYQDNVQEIKLENIGKNKTVLVVDALAPYDELKISADKEGVLELPKLSDWAVVIFDG